MIEETRMKMTTYQLRMLGRVLKNNGFLVTISLVSEINLAQMLLQNWKPIAWAFGRDKRTRYLFIKGEKDAGLG